MVNHQYKFIFFYFKIYKYQWFILFSYLIIKMLEFNMLSSWVIFKIKIFCLLYAIYREFDYHNQLWAKICYNLIIKVLVFSFSQ